jgi:hypothetical protein
MIFSHRSRWPIGQRDFPIFVDLERVRETRIPEQALHDLVDPAEPERPSASHDVGPKRFEPMGGTRSERRDLAIKVHEHAHAFREGHGAELPRELVHFWTIRRNTAYEEKNGDAILLRALEYVINHDSQSSCEKMIET